MSKADNMLSILWLLKTKKRITARELAEKLEIHIRTIYRYIDALCASGVPIIADSGHNGGYSLLTEFNEAPLLFDMNEQKALIHAAIFAQEAGYPFGESLTSAVAKLKKYTNEDQLNLINRHEAGIDVISTPYNGLLESVLQELELSVAGGFTLLMLYRKSHGKQPEPRSIDPYGLVLWKGKWYIVGYCHLRQAVRSFRVDRIHGISRTGAVFERPEDFSARAFLLQDLLPRSGHAENLVSVRIEGMEQSINDLCDHWLFGHMLVDRSERHVHVRMEEKALGMVPHLLMLYGRSVRIVEPRSLHERLVEVTSELLDYYKKQ
ncbi:helix-turn-helix transcriptional regulator [Paenibacillus sepulcri]|uniref:YafY family transcriptional regulator n=1 Tax=Paenibacillus sepulcri TaxID=359917 RepID=A0ABS7BYM4_9BACL|nr:YafY family transcriptional regulator [Paenibacillus sepulcri]